MTLIFLVGPIAVNTEPIDKMSVNVNSKTILNCSSEANPKPDYQWLQKLSSGQVRRRGSEASLVIGDTGYADQGEYTCVASNTIGGKQKKVQSEVVTVQVKGVPQVKVEDGDVVGITGSEVTLEKEFCSDPVPLRNTWEWDGVVLPSGSEIEGRYRAELMSHPEKEDCYISRLVVRGVKMGDGRTYILNVENKHGRDTARVELKTEGTFNDFQSIYIFM